MITPFGLRHIGLMYKLQGVSLTFEPKSALLEQPVTPLRTALRGYFLQSAAGAFTYVLRAADHGAEWRGLVLRPAPAGFVCPESGMCPSGSCLFEATKKPPSGLEPETHHLRSDCSAD